MDWNTLYIWKNEDPFSIPTISKYMLDGSYWLTLTSNVKLTLISKSDVEEILVKDLEHVRVRSTAIMDIYSVFN
jgi:hypothetical protein